MKSPGSGLERRAGEPRRELAGRATERAGISVHAGDPGAVTQRVGEREGERAVAAAQLEPAWTGALDAGADELDVIRVLHGRWSHAARRPGVAFPCTY